MGRWAQRKRAGGGPVTLNQMIQAVKTGGILVEVEWSADVDPASFEPTAFTSEPSGIINQAFAVIGPRRLELQFEFPVDADTELVYLGLTPGMLTPQTISYS